MSDNDMPTLRILAEAMDEVNRCTWLLFNEAETYADLRFAAMESKRLLAEMESKREIAWMFNLDRVLGKEATDER